MILFKELRWSNAFSYGKDNCLRLDGAPLTQLVGKNGNGKSSIALIIEEVLFNQNSKTIKKADILNRHSKDKSYTISLDFEKDGDEYTVKTVRNATTGTVTLTKNGQDISSHTSTGTYKSIEHIIGYDHKAFSQIVYQSSITSLEFLVATDTARKKFLIELLNLNKYMEASEVFKGLAASMVKQIDSLQAKAATVSSWLNKYEKEDLSEKKLLPEPDPVDTTRYSLLQNEIKNIDVTNKKINQNNTYKEIFSRIKLEIEPSESTPKEVYTGLLVKKANLEKELREGKSLASKYKGPTTKCPTCSQSIDNSTMFDMVKLFENSREGKEEELAAINAKIAKIDKEYVAKATYDKSVTEWEKYHALIDKDLQSDLLDIDVLTKELNHLQQEISDNNKAIAKAREHNTKVSAHNAKVKVIAEQMDSMKQELESHNLDLSYKTSELANLQLLVKAFSTTGLVAYKIECLVKDLEDITNQYLGILASGRFQLSFKITSSDKLNVVITDNGRDVSIVALSSGERARVNVATLLAIRKLMQSLSNSRTNLLILDETVENLDAEGKEKLIEVLLEEESLNTFLISHGFSHPLLEKVSVVKENNISRIE